MKSKSSVKTILRTQIVLFVFIFGYFFLPIEFSLPLFFFLALLALIFCILGIVLIISSRLYSGKVRSYIFLCGLASTFPFILSILHNVFYALGEVFGSISWVFEFLSVTSFVTSLLVAPVLFVISAFLSLKYIK